MSKVVWAICSASSIGTTEGVNDGLYPHLCNSKPLAATISSNAISRDVTWVHHRTPEMHGVEKILGHRARRIPSSNSAGGKWLPCFGTIKVDICRLHVTGSNNHYRYVLHETGIVKSCNRVQLPVVLTKEFASA
jgi:hypothetical protein